MSAPIAPTLCPHKVNPTTCWFCIRDAGQRRAHEAAARAAAGHTTGDPITDLVMRSAPIAPPPPKNVVPAPRGPQAFQAKSEAKAPKPQSMSSEQTTLFAAVQGRIAEQQSQFHWTQDAEGREVPPPKRPEVISQLPTHPEAQK